MNIIIKKIFSYIQVKDCNFRLILLFFAYCSLIIVLDSCNTIRHTLKEPLKEKGADYLFENLRKHETNYKTISAKFSAELDYNGKKNTFGGMLRIQNDSAIWISITPALGIEAARLIITNDSIKLLNRFNKTFIICGYYNINYILKAGFDFDMVEALLSGNDFSYYDVDKFKAKIDNREYRLSTVNRQRIKRYVKKSNENLKILLQDIWLNPETFKITKTDINEIKENRKLNVKYSNFKEIKQQLFPETIEFVLIDKNPIKIILNYSKVTFDELQTFPFKIPSGYKRLNITN